jgi:hypothetical protein
MIQFVLFVSLLAHTGDAPKKFNIYGKPQYFMEEGACEEAADKVAQQIFSRGKRAKFKKVKIELLCSKVPSVDI